MSFLYATLIGVILGLSGLSIPNSIILMLILISLRLIKDIMLKKDFITGVTSPYQMYLANLEKMKLSKDYAAIKYYLQALLFDGLISITIIGLIKYFI